MRKFIQSGGAFLALAMVFLVLGFVSENTGVFTGLGVFWLIMGLILRARNAKKPPAA